MSSNLMKAGEKESELWPSAKAKSFQNSFSLRSSDDEDFRSLFTAGDLEEEEDFESEMKRERLCHVNGVHNSCHQQSNLSTHSDKQSGGSEKATNTSQTNPSDKSEPTDDDLLYDPDADDEDQKWVDEQRQASVGAANAAAGNRKPPQSDAVLNCPCCMTMLCLDCQRHEIYKTQFRAMFVFNCTVDFDERLEYKAKNKRQRRFRATGSEKCASEAEVDNYFAVKCSICSTQVAVYDRDEVYHFFNVLSSYS